MASTTPPASERPLRRDAERNRLRILQAAREVFADRGFDASLDQVAAHAGLGVGTVYRRFADKDALIDALFEEGIDEVAAAQARALSTRPVGGPGRLPSAGHTRCEPATAG